MLKFCSNLYMDDAVYKDSKKIIHNLKRNKGEITIYVIALNPESGKPEMFHSAFLQQKYYKKHSPLIIGLASGRDSAMNLLSKVILDAYENDPSMDCRKILLKDK